MCEREFLKKVVKVEGHRVTCKTPLINSINDMHQAAPTYLAELCSPVSESASRGHLRSAVRGDLVVPLSLIHI